MIWQVLESFGVVSVVDLGNKGDWVLGRWNLGVCDSREAGILLELDFGFFEG